MSMFEDAKKFPKMEVNEERKGVLYFRIQSVTHHDHFIHTLEIVYVEMKDTEKKKRKRETLILPAAQMITADVIQYGGLKTVVSHFPMRIIGDEVWNTTPVNPYVSVDGKDMDVSSKLKLVLLSEMWNAYSIIVDKE